MKRDFVRSIYECPESYSGKEVTLGGWVRNLRDSKAFGFIDLNDGSCFKGVQVVFEKDKLENFAEVAKYNVGAAVIVEGNLILTPEAKQPFEINATKVTLEGASAPEYPLQKKSVHPILLEWTPSYCLKSDYSQFPASLLPRSIAPNLMPG